MPYMNKISQICIETNKGFWNFIKMYLTKEV